MEGTPSSRRPGWARRAQEGRPGPQPQEQEPLQLWPGCPRPATLGATHSTLHQASPALPPGLLGSPSPRSPATPLLDTSLSCLLPEYTGLGVELGGLLTNSQVTPRVPWTVWGTL